MYIFLYVKFAGCQALVVMVSTDHSLLAELKNKMTVVSCFTHTTSATFVYKQIASPTLLQSNG